MFIIDYSTGCWPHVWEIRSSAPGQDKPITERLYLLLWRSALIGQGKDSLAQCHDNVTELGYWDHAASGLMSHWDSSA